MRPSLDRIKEQLRSGDVSQDVLGSLANTVPTDGDFNEIMCNAPSDLDSFQEVIGRIKRLEDYIITKNERQTVRFIDYDGSVVQEVELEDLPLKKVPKAPNHRGDFVPLTFTGWTHSLGEINSATHSLDVGAQYKPTDGKLHCIICVSEKDVLQDKNVLSLSFIPHYTEMRIDWGNGESESVVPSNSESSQTVTFNTTYNSVGTFDLCVDVGENDSLYITIPSITSVNLIRGIVIPYGIKKIENNTFPSLDSMKTIVIPDSVEDIYDGAFFGCNALRGLVIPNSVKRTANSVFHGTDALENLVLGNGLTTLGSSNFSDASCLTRIIIPDSLTSIGSDAFHNIWHVETMIIGENVETIGTYTFEFCTNLRSLVIPDSVTELGQGTFYSVYALQNLVIGDGLQTISNNGFIECYNLKNVVIGNGVTSIGAGAFFNCINMEMLVLGSNLQTVSSIAFKNCYSLKSLVIPDGVISIESSAFESCFSLQSLLLGNSLKTIGNSAFKGCYSLKSLVIPDSVKSMPSDAFYNCFSLQNLVIGNGLPEIQMGTFYYCYSLQDLFIGTGVIKDSAFYNCYSLRNLVISNSVQNISGFNNCHSLQKLVIPDSVTTIQNYAFYYGYSLQEVVIGKGLNSIYGSAFGGTNNIYTSPKKVYIRQKYEEGSNFSAMCNAYFKRSELVWGYNMSVVGLSIDSSNEYVRFGYDNAINVTRVYKYDDELLETDPVFSEDTLDHMVLTCSDNATLEDGVLRPLVDSGTIAVTATLNDGSGYSVTKEFNIISPSVTVNLHDGQWVDTGTEVDGHKVYKSDAGSYHIADGMSRCTLEFIGYNSLKIYRKNASNDSSNDFVVTGYINGTATRTSYYSKTTSSSYSYVTFTSPSQYDSSIVNTVDILYTKNGTTDSGEDCGYFYYVAE